MPSYRTLEIQKKIDGSVCGDWKIFWDEGSEGYPLATPRTGAKVAKEGGLI